MASFPFFCVLEAALASGASATLQYQLPQGETFRIKAIRYASTGAYNITDIRNSSGVHYTNASVSVELPGSIFPDMDTFTSGLDVLPVDLVLEGGSILYIDIEEASAAANTVTLVLAGVKETP